MRGARHRRGGAWSVRARVERFSEPALLMLLRERPAHGYELVEALEGLLAAERVDMGNVYRALRALEREGLVTSRWDAEAPGPARRVYELTDPGRGVLDQWAAALRRTRDRIDGFLERYEKEGGEHVPRR
jgi:PadR family transcriptional regulator PadR